VAAVVVTLGTVTIDGSTVDANGATWHLKELDGWDSPDLRSTLLDLPGHDRESLGPLLHRGRALSVRGKCQTPTDAAYWASRTKLAGTTLLTATTGTLTVAETTTKKITVSRAGRVLMKPLGGLKGFEFEVPLIAPDPRILANTGSSIAAAGTATNNGNFKAAWVLTVTGAAAGPVVLTRTAPGATRTISITTAVPGGQTLVIDSRARSVVLNGVNRYDLVTATPEWFDLEPGANTIGYSGGGTFVLAWNDSWM
jgi:hypothetical protein